MGLGMAHPLWVVALFVPLWSMPLAYATRLHPPLVLSQGTLWLAFCPSWVSPPPRAR